MKTVFTILSMMLIASLGYAQNGPITFEPGEEGADWTWTVFENDTNPDLEIIPNPDPTGANSSATVAQFTALQSGNPWAGCESQQVVDLGTFEWDSTNTTVKIMVWKTKISDVGIKFDSETGWSEGEIKVSNTVVNEWEELTFDFSNASNPPAGEGELSRIVIFPDFDLDGRTEDNISYFDNITFEAGGGGGNPEEPEVAASDPTEDEADVISLFSGVYTDESVDTWRTPWSSANLEDVEIQGNATKKYTNLDFVGVETTGDNLIDATEMDMFHIDVWTPNMDTVRIKLVDWGPDGQFDGGDDTEDELIFTDLEQGTWNSLALPLSDFANLQNRASMAQYIFSGTPTGGGTLFVDNVYFSQMGGGNPDEPAVAAPDPTEDEANVISLFSGVYTDEPVDTWRTVWSSADFEDVEIQGNPTKKYTNLDFVGVETTGDNLIDATEMDMFHIDLWTPNMDTVRIKLVDFGPDGQFAGGDDSEDELVFTDLEQGTWNSLALPLSDFANLQNRASMAQYIFSGIPVGGGTLFVDNVYFSKMPTSTPEILRPDFTIYPNPAKDRIWFNTEDRIISCTLFNSAGQPVLQRQNPGQSLGIGFLQKGLYVAQIEFEDGTVQRKIIVQ